MNLHVQRTDEGHVLAGDGPDVVLVNGFLAHLSTRNFAAATQRAYCFDLLNFLRFLTGRGLSLVEVRPLDLFDYLDWQAQPRRAAPGSVVVRLADRRGAAPATMNRRIAAVRGVFEYAMLAGHRLDNPVPAARRSGGVRARHWPTTQCARPTTRR